MIKFRFPFICFILLTCQSLDGTAKESNIKHAMELEMEINSNFKPSNQMEVLDDSSDFTPPSLKGLHFSETFQTDPFQGEHPRWVKCNGPKPQGTWKYDKREIEGIKNDYGIVMIQSYAYHCLATKIPTYTPNQGRNFIFQFEVQHQDKVTCGGAYAKLMNYDGRPEDIKKETPFIILFGPDKCGPDYNQVLFILKYKQKNGQWTEHHATSLPSIPHDHRTHVYTLVLLNNNNFEIYLDQQRATKGNLLKDLMPSIQPAEFIDDISDTQPIDWDDRVRIDDPDAIKPEDWDESQPKTIPDINSIKPNDWLETEPKYIIMEKPEYWDEERDGKWTEKEIPNPKCQGVSGCGKWEQNMIPNPNYQGPWYPPKILNPNYMGSWNPRKIKNPDFFVDEDIYQVGPINTIAFETWNVEDNIIIDNIIISDDIKKVLAFTDQTWKKRIKGETLFHRTYFEKDIATPETIKQPFIYIFQLFLVKTPWAVLSAIIVIGISTQCFKLSLVMLKARIKSHKTKLVENEAGAPQDNNTTETVSNEVSNTKPRSRK